MKIPNEWWPAIIAALLITGWCAFYQPIDVAQHAVDAVVMEDKR